MGVNDVSISRSVKSESNGNSNDVLVQQNHDRQTGALFETMLHLTTVIHTFIFAFLVLILYICFSTEWSFFVWHPFLMTIGWWLLASEGILLLRNDNVFSKCLNRQWKIRLHWLVQGVAAACNISGFIVVFINKDRNNRNHFTSYHGKFGLVTVIISLLTLFGGTCALYSTALRTRIKPSLNKALHVLFAIVAYVFAIVTFLFAVYSSGWFKNRINQNEFIQVLGFVILIVTTVWLLFKPFISFLSKIRVSFS